MYNLFALQAEPEELLSDAGKVLVSSEKWIIMEREEFFSAMLWSVFFIVSGVICHMAVRFFFSRIRKRSLKLEIFYALILPLVPMAVSTGIFFVFFPLMKTLPEFWYRLDIRLFYTLMVIFAAWGSCRVIAVFDKKIRSYAERNDNDLEELTVGMIGSVLKTAVILTAFFFIGQNIFDVNLTALLASAGVAGLALALAAKDTVSNFFGTLVIIADNPFRTGDRIVSEKISGIVQSVGMRSSRILQDDESIAVVPNSILSNTPLVRVDRKGVLKYSFDIALTYSTDVSEIKKAEKILHGIVDDLGGKDALENRPHIYFSGFGDYSLNIHVIIWLKASSFREAEKLTDMVNCEILEKFNVASLQFAYPSETIFLAGSASDRSR